MKTQNLWDLSDGDIKKNLESNSINKQVNFESKIVNKNFVSANYNSSIKQITTKLDKEINGKKLSVYAS